MSTTPSGQAVPQDPSPPAGDEVLDRGDIQGSATADDEDQDEEELPVLDLPEVMVIGPSWDDGVPDVPLDTVGSRDVFGPERIQDTGARDLNDLVQHLPAISTRPYNGGEAAAPSFSMRGLPDDGLTEYVNVLIDGVPASALPYGWTAFSFLPITTERVFAIDYIRGGHSIRYSPNTVGGILNIITEPIPGAGTATLKTTFGTFDYSSNLVSVGGTSGSVGARATFVDRRGDGYRDDGEFDQQDSNFKLRWDLDPDAWWAVSASYMESEHQAPGGLTQAQFDVDRFGNARPRNRFDGSRTVLDSVYHRDGDQSWLEWFTYVSETERRLDAQRPHFGAPATFLEWEDESYFLGTGLRVEQQVEFLGLEHTLYGGVRYHGEWIPSWTMHSTPFAGGPRTKTQDSEFTLNTLSAHLDDTFQPLEHLTVNLGARLEWIPKARGEDDVTGMRYDERFLDLLPGVGVNYQLTHHWALYANHFEGFRAPQVWGFAFTNPADDELTFEEGRSSELGTRLVNMAGLSGSVTAWRTEYDDFGTFDSGFYENLGRIVAKGVDFVLDYDIGESCECLDGFSAYASLTVQDSELRSGPDRNNQVPYAWKKKAAWRVRYETGSRWSASLGGVYVGPSYSDSANTGPDSADGTIGRNQSWTVWDARLAKVLELGEATDLNLAVGVTNLLDTDWEVHSRGGFFGGGLVAGAPRQVYGSVQLTAMF